jgi:CheY-like chemotaxis protein
MAAKLLNIDDEVGLTKVVGLIAEQLGMDFRALDSSLGAIEMFLDYKPDVVMLDMIMPGKDGIDVLDEIMRTGIPTQIVLTSGYSDAFLKLGQGVAKFHGVEGIRILKKPFRRAELVELLTEITSGTIPVVRPVAHSCQPPTRSGRAVRR